MSASWQANQFLAPSAAMLGSPNGAWGSMPQAPCGATMGGGEMTLADMLSGKGEISRQPQLGKGGAGPSSQAMDLLLSLQAQPAATQAEKREPPCFNDMGYGNGSAASIPDPKRLRTDDFFPQQLQHSQGGDASGMFTGQTLLGSMPGSQPGAMPALPPQGSRGGRPLPPPPPPVPSALPVQFAQPMPQLSHPMPSGVQLPMQMPLAPLQQTMPTMPQSNKQNQNKQIAMQFLNADRQTQNQMLRDPNIAGAILQTLGESAPSPTAGGMPAAPSTCAAEPNAQWSGKMTLARSLGKQLNTQATLLFGKVQAVELALRISSQNGGILNISHRAPFDDLARRSPAAILALAPLVPQEQKQYDEYAKYFRSKVRAGVARLDEADALYLVPPCAEAEQLLGALHAAGATGLPKHCLLAVIAATPGPAGGVAPAAA